MAKTTEKKAKKTVTAKKAPAKKVKESAQKAVVKKQATAASVEQAPALTEVKVQHAEKPKAVKTGTYYYANGKRKTSVACVRLFTNGKGTITVNNRIFENYFPVFTDQDKILSPLNITSTQKLFDVSAKVFGGGIHSQAEALRHGISKALLAYDVALRTTLKTAGFLTRDSRVKERKKYGLKRARRAPQWQKR